MDNDFILDEFTSAQCKRASALHFVRKLFPYLPADEVVDIAKWIVNGDKQ